MVLTPLVIGIGLVIGLIRGGRIDAVLRSRVAMWPLLAAGIVLQTLGESFDLPGRAAIVMLGLLCLVVVATQNIHIPGAAISGIGISLNLAVLLVNGHIPVRFEALTAFGNDVAINPAASPTGLWQLEDDSTSLAFLGDIVPVPVLDTTISFGDLIMLAGLLVLAMNIVLQGRRPGIEVDDLFGVDPEEPGLAGIPRDAIIDTDLDGADIDLRDAVVVVRDRPGDHDVRQALFDEVPADDSPEA